MVEGFTGEIRSRREHLSLDLIDRKLLYLLSENGRYSHNALAKSLRVRRETIAYRLKRLEELGFLHGYFTLIDTTQLGFVHYIMYCKLRSSPNMQTILTTLRAQNSITRIKRLAGAYDLQIIFTVRSATELETEIDTLLLGLGPSLKDYELLQLVEEDFPGMKVLLGPEERQQLRIKDARGTSYQNIFANRTYRTRSIDASDKQLLSILSHQGRTTKAQLSRLIGLAPTSIDARMKKLIETGIIKKIYPLFAISQLDYQWYKLLFRVQNINKNKFYELLKTKTQIMWQMKLIGHWNFQASAFVKNSYELYDLINEFKAELGEDLVEHDIILVIDQEKFDYRFD